MSKRIPDAEVAILHARYLAGEEPREIARERGCSEATVYDLFRRRGLALRGRLKPQPSRVPLDEILAMHADHQAGMTLAAIGRKYGRDRGSARELFKKRGLEIRPSATPPAMHNPDGTFVRHTPLTASQIDGLIAKAEKVAIPPELRQEWRHWPMEKRRAFVARLFAKVDPPGRRPEAPFSWNVEPFSYGSPRAHEIADRLNAGRDSRSAVIKIDLRSQGVIWGGELWFWSGKAGYVCGPWIKGQGRRLLHHEIYKLTRGPIPAGGVVRFIDGNPNNMAPGNLTLSDRNTLCRENQAAALTRKARSGVRTLLNRNAQPRNRHDTLATLHGRSAVARHR